MSTVNEVVAARSHGMRVLGFTSVTNVHGLGLETSHEEVLEEITSHGCTQKFLRAEQDHFPPADPIYALQRDLFDFVLVATPEEGHLVARRIDVPPEQPAQGTR